MQTAETATPGHLLACVIRSEVESRLGAGGVVGLESVVFAHGLPRVDAVALAEAVVDAIHGVGGEPAICAIVGGIPRVGLSIRDVETFLDRHPIKVTPAGLPPAMAGGLDAATTAGSTMVLCHQAGIRVVATGGIGGVHRGRVRDVSADISCLSKLPLVVVCSGAKSLLDVSATFEALETEGVTVVGFQTGEIPGFYTVATGLKAPWTANSPHEVADIWSSARRMGLQGAVLVLNPPPAEYAYPIEVIERAVTQAVASSEGVSGPDVTPHQLRHIQDMLGPGSIHLNRELLIANARLAAQISVAVGGR